MAKTDKDLTKILGAPAQQTGIKRGSGGKLVTKGFRVTPEAMETFNVLVARQGPGKDTGPRLIAEALNLLFKKYGVDGVT
jgi:hypothetical protein